MAGHCCCRWSFALCKDEGINVKNDIISLYNYFQSTRVYYSSKKLIEVFLVFWILKQWQKMKAKLQTV